MESKLGSECWRCAAGRTGGTSISLRTATMLFACFAALVSAAPSQANEPEVPEHLHVPPGYEIERIAAPPLVTHPMMASFDDRGRLYVADAAGLNLDNEELLRDLPNRMLRLEDVDGDGRFDRQTVFADKMTFPMGSLWHDGRVYVASPPSIWTLLDADDDGVAETREELVSKFGFIGNAADIHGCFLGPDGRVYWCDGRHGHEFVDGEGNTISKGKAARIFSCRTDGSQLEAYCGGGMDNPVEVTFSDEGELFGTMTFYNPDDERHDALVHYHYGGVYPRRHEVVAEFQRTGDFLPPLVLYGTVAPAGLMRYQGTALGDDFNGNLFSVQFNTHLVLRHRLARSGATFTAVDEPMLESNHVDFHPTDVLEDADGSLLVIDTGGWFRYGCPTSQVAKPEILGAIYRIRRREAPRIVDPRGLELDWSSRTAAAALVNRLRDERFAVRERAVAALAARGDAAVAPLAAAVAEVAADGAGHSSAALDAAKLALWTLCRIDTPAARGTLRQVLKHREPRLRRIAACALGTLRDAESLAPLIALVADEDACVRRNVATALGRIGSPAAVPALLEALAADNERSIEHALLFAMMETNDPSTTLEGLAHTSPLVRRGALLALDQMHAQPLTASHVAPLLDSADPALRRAALEVLTRHPQWTEELIERVHALVDAQKSAESASEGDSALVRGALVALSTSVPVQELVAQGLTDSRLPDAARVLLIDVVGQVEIDPPSAWLEGLAVCARGANALVAGAALETIARLGNEKLIDVLREVSQRETTAAELRATATLALARLGQPLDDAHFSQLTAQLSQESVPLERWAAAEALGRAALSDKQRKSLATVFAAAGPLELPKLLAALEQPETTLTAAHWKALSESPGLVAVGPARLQALIERTEPAARNAAEQLVARLAPSGADQRQRLLAFEAALGSGDAAAGKELFLSTKTACSACHRIAGVGGQLGPDLSHIGQIRARRDLLESIVFPSLSLARGYESVTLATHDGHVHTGILSRETPQMLYLRTARRDEIRVPRGEVETLGPSSESIMPVGFDRVLSSAELSNLIAYLETLR